MHIVDNKRSIWFWYQSSA